MYVLPHIYEVRTTINPLLCPQARPPTFPGVYFKGGSLIMGTGYLRGGLCNLVGAIYYFLKQPEDVINSSFKN